jgi:ankyrin repeat protein
MDAEFATPALAIFGGELDTLRMLLTDDPDLATRRSSCGHPTLLQLVACEAGDIADPVGAAAVLVEAGAETAGPLVAAAGCNAPAVVEYLLDHGAPVDGTDSWSPLDEAIYWDNTEMAELLRRRRARISRLGTAAGLGDLAAIDGFFAGDGTLLPGAGPIGSPFPDTVPARGTEGGADDPQSIVDHAFVMAVNSGRLDAARHLLQRGADVNAAPPGYHWRGTALHAACWRGNQELVEWLLSVGADPSIRDRMEGVGADAVGWARHHGHDHLVAALTGNRDSGSST